MGLVGLLHPRWPTFRPTCAMISRCIVHTCGNRGRDVMDEMGSAAPWGILHDAICRAAAAALLYVNRHLYEGPALPPVRYEGRPWVLALASSPEVRRGPLHQTASREVKHMTAQQPVGKFRAGTVTCALWQNEIIVAGEKKNILKASIERRYRDQAGEWKSSGSYSRNEIPLAIYCLHKAFEAILTETGVPGQLLAPVHHWTSWTHLTSAGLRPADGLPALRLGKELRPILFSGGGHYLKAARGAVSPSPEWPRARGQVALLP